MRFTCKCELGSQNSAEQHNHSSISNNSGQSTQPWKRVYLKCTHCKEVYSNYIYCVLGCEDGKSQGKRVYLKCTHCKEVYSNYIYCELGCEDEKSQGKRVYLKWTNFKEMYSILYIYIYLYIYCVLRCED